MLHEILPNKINEAMKQLSDEHSDILVMVNIKGMSYSDVAMSMNVPVSAVRGLLSAARESLQNILDTPLQIQRKYTIPPYQKFFTPALQQAA